MRLALTLSLVLATGAAAQPTSDLVARALDPSAWQVDRLEPTPTQVLHESGDAEAARLAAYVVPLVDAHFPRLQTRTIRLVRFQSDDTYFMTQLAAGEAARDSEHRIYDLHFNPKLFEDPPPPIALDAILAHELVHIDGYTRLSTFSLTTLAARYTGSTAFRERYERETDEAVLDLGKAEGLKAYRLWIYPKLSRDDYVVKRRTYWTPEEIDLWLEARRPLDQMPSPISLEGLIRH